MKIRSISILIILDYTNLKMAGMIVNKIFYGYKLSRAIFETN